MSARTCLAVAATAAVFILCSGSASAKPDASAKFSVIREGNAKNQKETLVLPYGFPSESMGTTFGVGALAKGYLQDQLFFGATVFGSVDEARGIIGGFWDYRIPGTSRLYLTAYGAYAHYPEQRAYSQLPRFSSNSVPETAGSNNSSKDNYLQDEGDDNWFELKLEYVLPIGSMKEKGKAEYFLKNGILTSGASGGGKWNPLETGITVLLLGSSSRYQSYETETVTYNGDTFPFQLGLLYNNTDFPTNPTQGSSQYFAFNRDFSESVSGSWSFIEFEASKYIDLGPSAFSSQQVAAFNFWTGTSPSSKEIMDSDGNEIAGNRPPFTEGARLGGMYRLRAYPNNRFNDKSVIYTTAEYRYTLKWNPVADVQWLKWLKCDWFQIVGFAEGGRVAGDYDLTELFSDWKFDAGIGIRSMMAGAVVRLDFAISEESNSAWVMFGHPF